nr:helix-turn-helix domain-containing protein [Bacteroides intestinalis]
MDEKTIERPVLNLKDASIYTSLSVRCLRTLLKSGRIPYYRPNGKLIFIERKDLDAFLRSNPSVTEKGGIA